MVVVLAVLLLVVLLAAVLFVLDRNGRIPQGLERASHVSQIVGLVVAVLGLVVTLATFLGSAPQPTALPPMSVTTPPVTTPPTTVPATKPTPATAAVTIESPADDDHVGSPIRIAGTCGQLSGDVLIWVVSYSTRDHQYYPQYESVQDGDRCVAGRWESPDIYVSRHDDERQDIGDTFVNLAVTVDLPTAARFAELRSSYASLPALPAGVVEYDRVTLIRG
jgi:hypothetical protein